MVQGPTVQLQILPVSHVLKVKMLLFFLLKFFFINTVIYFVSKMYMYTAWDWLTLVVVFPCMTLNNYFKYRVYNWQPLNLIYCMVSIAFQDPSVQLLEWQPTPCVHQESTRTAPIRRLACHAPPDMNVRTPRRLLYNVLQDSMPPPIPCRVLLVQQVNTRSKYGNLCSHLGMSC